jgi:Fe-S cluster biogenesis protein NfuA
MISVIDTPNPDTKKFVFEQTIVSSSSKEFKKSDNTDISFVKELFLNNNLELIYLDKNFISIKKNKDCSWDDIIQNILDILGKNIDQNFKPLSFKEESNFTDDISKRIEEVLNDKIRPAVAMDGGDIRLKSFKNGVAEVMLKGACAGCPSSTVTLKHGVERMIKHYVPEVTSVEAYNINE